MDQMAYCGRCKCGKIVAALIDTGSGVEKTAKIVAEWIKGGLKVERHTVDDTQKYFTGCACERQEKLF